MVAPHSYSPRLAVVRLSLRLGGRGGGTPVPDDLDMLRFSVIDGKQGEVWSVKSLIRTMQVSLTEVLCLTLWAVNGKCKV